ncbi:MAG: MFS transporter [Firmicutes bacterium]|nr:MFS transporter [Bacillota bacterium]
MKERSYLVFWLGQTVSVLGDVVAFVALPVWVYYLTGSKAALGLSFATNVLPRLLLAPVAGVYVDRWDRRRTMITCDLLRAVALAGLFLVRDAGDVGLIYGVNFFNACVSRFYLPARNALIPDLVGTDKLVAANSLASVSESAAQLVGPLLGGVLVTLGGPKSAVALDLVTFLLAALSLSSITVKARADGATDRTARRVTADLVAGLGLAWKTTVLRYLLLTFCLVALAQGALVTLLLPFLTEILGLPSDYFGVVVAVEGAGALVGGLLVGSLARRLKPETLFASSLLAVGLVLGLIVAAADFGWLLCGLVVEGAVGVGVAIATTTILQARVPEQFRGRVHSLWSMTSSVSMVGMMSAGLVADAIGTRLALVAAGALAALAGLVAFMTMSRGDVAHSSAARPESVAPGVGLP